MVWVKISLGFTEVKNRSMFTRGFTQDMNLSVLGESSAFVRPINRPSVDFLPFIRHLTFFSL